MCLQSRRVQVLILAVLSATATACAARERATMTVSYVVGPARPMPEGLKAVAVIDAGVKTEGAQEDDRERKWAGIAADMIEAMLQNAEAQAGGSIAVAKRGQTKRILEEQDLRLAGLVEGEAATRAAKLLAVQGLITSKITIHIDVERGAKSTLDWGGILGGAIQELGNSRDHGDRRQVRVVRPAPRAAPPRSVRTRDGREVRVVRPAPPPRAVYLYGPPVREPKPSGGAFGGLTFKTREVEEISRNLTVQCSFSLIDANTGQALVQYSPPPYQKKDSSSPDFLFGSMSQEELDPVDHFIGELVERATQEFVGKLVPVRVEETYNFSVSGKNGEKGVLALRADDYPTAMNYFQAELRGDDDDDGRTHFAMGVTAELMGQPEKALQYYRQAAASPDVDKKDLPMFLSAKQRLTDHMGRIIRPNDRPPAPPGADPAAAPPAPPAGGQPPAQPPPAASPPPPGAAPQSSSDNAPKSVEDEIRILKDLEGGKK